MCGRAVADGADLIGGLADDRKNDDWSVRMQAKSGVTTELEMMEDKTEGCDSLWFYAGLYGEKDTGVKLSVDYSLDGGRRGCLWQRI